MENDHRVSPIEGSVHVFAEMSRHDKAIRINDIVAHAENVAALVDWAQGTMFDSDGVRAKLLQLYPHLKERG